MLTQQHEMFNQQQEMFKQLMEEKGKGKGRGRGKTNRSESLPTIDPGPSNPTGFLGSLRSAFRGQTNQQADDVSSNSSFSIIEDSNRADLPQSNQQQHEQEQEQQQQQHRFRRLGGTTEKVWITKLQLELNGAPVDQLASEGDEEQAMRDFYRLYRTMGLANSLDSLFVDMSRFLDGTFISAWDLTTSGFVGNSFAIPNVKTGTK